MPARSEGYTATQTGDFLRPVDTTLSYRKLTPKLGLTYYITDDSKLFASYRHGLRVPTENQLFSQGGSASSVDLRPALAGASVETPRPVAKAP